MRKLHGMVIVALNLVLTVPESHGVLPMREQWRFACSQFSSGNAAAAVAAFDEFDRWYKDEPALKDPDFRETRLRLKGLACLQAKQIESGLELLLEWLDDAGSDTPFQAYIRYQVAKACLALGKLDGAIGHCHNFIKDHPQLPERVLIFWMISDIELMRGNPPLAREALKAIMQGESAGSVTKSLARASMALIEITEESNSTAFTLLDRNEMGNDDAFRLWRSVLAPSLTAALIRDGEYSNAIKASGWFDTNENLQAIIVSWTNQYASSARSASLRQHIWKQHWQSQAHRLRQSGMKLGEGITPDILYGLKLEALIKGEQSLEATFLAMAILEMRTEMSPDLLAKAYTSAIKANHQLKRWQPARSLANEFLRSFPGHEAIPEILLLNARTAAGQNDHESALEQVSSLLHLYPDHPSALTWKMLEGQWLLASGEPATAIRKFNDLIDQADPPWIPYIHFQVARGCEALKQHQKACDLFQQVVQNELCPVALSEQATVEQLKIWLHTLQEAEFLESFERFPARYPHAMNENMVANLGGLFHKTIGNIDKASELFAKVSHAEDPEANFAHKQLSLLYRENGDMNHLLNHSLRWIQQHLESGITLSEEAFQDCLHFQKTTGDLALPSEIVTSLLSELDSSHAAFPIGPLLDVISSMWNRYRISLQSDKSSPLEWCEARALRCYRNGNPAGYIAYLLYSARILDQQKRPDSADAKRIQALEVDLPGSLDPESFLKLATVADRYDFPEAINLLNRFLNAHAASPLRPQALHLLAQRKLRSGSHMEAQTLLHEIYSQWPDSPSHIPACMDYAASLTSTGRHLKAAQVTSSVLDNPEASANVCATALLLRAQADLALQLYERAIVSCIRILSLYPDFHDIASEAKSILSTNLTNISDPQQLNHIKSFLL